MFVLSNVHVALDIINLTERKKFSQLSRNVIEFKYEQLLFCSLQSVIRLFAKLQSVIKIKEFRPWALV